MAVTIQDVARAAGVSVATAARAIHGRAHVTLATRERVRRVAEHLRYLPDSPPRQRTAGRTGAVGVLLPELHGDFYSEIIRGLDAAARARGLSLLLAGVRDSLDEATYAVRSLRGRVDGLLLMAPQVDARRLEAHAEAGVPVVLLNARPSAGRWPSLSIDNAGGARAVVRHLAASGRRRIAFIGGPDGNQDADERRAGYRAAMSELGLAAARHELPGDFSEASGYRAGQRVLAGGARPDAVFAANDAMALGCLSALHEAGVQVPDQVTLAGFDDIPVARVVTPPLTSVSVSMTDLGERAIARLAAAIGAPAGSAMGETLAAALVVRRSSLPGLRAS